MANKRDLKRTINYITSELFAECVAASLYNGKPEQEDVDGIISVIVMTNTNLTNLLVEIRDKILIIYSLFHTWFRMREVSIRA